jgi:hypothetical protein
MTSGGSAYGNDRVFGVTPAASNGEYATLLGVDERRRRVLLIAATILAARKLAPVPAGQAGACHGQYHF